VLALFVLLLALHGASRSFVFFIKLKDFMVVENWWNFDCKEQKIALS
jgi:hypothetical protein